MAIQLTPRRGNENPGGAQSAAVTRLRPNPNYKPMNLHTRHKYGNRLPVNGPILYVDVEWCPVCHAARNRITERMRWGKPIWHCDECRYEW